MNSKSEKELELLQSLENEYSTLLSNYGDDYKLFISEYNTSLQKVDNCKQECVTKYSTGANSNELIKSCQIGCVFKNPSINECSNTYEKSKLSKKGCSDMLKAENGSLMCQNGEVTTGNLDYVTNPNYADSNGMTLKDGCCDCGGGINGSKQKVNAKLLGSCNDILNIYESYSPTTSPGKDIIEACNAAPFKQSNISLKDKYKDLSKQNKMLKEKANKYLTNVILRSKIFTEDEIMIVN